MDTSQQSAGDGITPGSVKQTGIAAAIEQLHFLSRKAFEVEALLQSAHDLVQAMVAGDHDALSRVECLLGLSVDTQCAFSTSLNQLHVDLDELHEADLLQVDLPTVQAAGYLNGGAQ